MMRSLYSAISGLKVNQSSMDVIGNNISNVNTTGYKSGRAVFQDLLSQTLVGGKTPTDASGGVNPRQVGLGSFLSAVDNIFESGTPTSTSKTTDLAIQGDGFFVIRGAGLQEYYYTRAGDFNFDRYGTLVNPSGYKVQGWMADPLTGKLIDNGEAGDIIVDSSYQTIQAKTTSKVSMNAVLNTVANASVMSYPSLMHTSNSTNSIFSVFSSSGVKMDLAENEAILIKADATAMTNMLYAHNSSDANLDLTKQPNLMMYVNGTAHTFSYPTDFTTMGDLANSIQGLLNTTSGGTDFTVNVENGKFKVTRNTDNGVDVQINSFTGSPFLAVTMQSLSGTYNEPSVTKSSGEIFFEQTKYAGRDFTTLSELGGVIEQAIDGNVIAADNFSVNFDETKGKFEFRNTYDPANPAASKLALTNFMVDKAYSGNVFENNLTPSGSLNVYAADSTSPTVADSYAYSGTFLRYAKGDDLLTDLYTNKGETLGLDNTAIIQFSGSIGGNALQGTGTIPALGSTVDDLRTMMAGYMGFNNTTPNQVKEHISSVDDNNGAIKVTGEKGVSNSIDHLKFEVVGNASYANFYDYFQYQTTQNASGGQLATTQTIYDAQGNAHTVKYNYEMVESTGNIWKLTLSTAEENTSVAFNSTGGNEVLLHFNNDGSFNYITATSGERVTDLSYNFNPANGAGIIPKIDMFVGTPANYDGVYISAKESAKISANQDGYALGNLKSTTFNTAGEIVGYYTNGQIMTIAQIALASFTNKQGLMKVGDTMFSETGNSGAAAIGKPETGNRGQILSGSLESSNVDLSTEFVSMITTQRGFQANSRVITTSDEMLQELLTLKR